MDDYDYDLYDDEPYIIVENREGSAFAPFLIGLVLGAGIALLIAPQSGEETRRDIAGKVKRAKDAARDAVGELGDVIGDTFDQARESGESISNLAVKGADLEDVFMQLTGREYRE